LEAFGRVLESERQSESSIALLNFVTTVRLALFENLDSLAHSSDAAERLLGAELLVERYAHPPNGSVVAETWTDLGGSP